MKGLLTSIKNMKDFWPKTCILGGDCARCDSFEMKQTSTQTLQDLCAYVFHQQQQNPQSMHSSLPSQTQFATI